MSAPRDRKQARTRSKPVVIPAHPELTAHADAIRTLGRRAFDDVIEIGQRLVECRKLLKAQRVWLAWLKAEFGWSRRTADRFVDLFKAKDKVRKLRILPMSSLYLLAKASPKVIAIVKHRIRVRWVSYEPALGPLGSLDVGGALPGWVVVGGESGKNPREMNPQWARDVRDECAARSIAFFCKQMTGKAPIPADLLIRQFPA